MAGVKGRSGGRREGAGRKPHPRVKEVTTKIIMGEPEPEPEKPKPEKKKPEPKANSQPPIAEPNHETIYVPEMDMLSLLKKIALGHFEVSTTQLRAAIAAVQYTHHKKGEGGKKEEKEDRANKAATGMFKPRVVK